MKRAEADLSELMEEPLSPLVDSEDEEDSYNTLTSQKVGLVDDNESGEGFGKNDMRANPSDDELSLESYDVDALEVSSGKFKAAYCENV
jgi:hypothetical protein